MSKLIFFDIDGTLWDAQMEIAESTVTALHGLRERGHKIFLCSGRARGNIRSDKLLGIGFDGIVAACGNHIEMDGKILYEYILPPEQVRRVFQITRECRMPVVLEGPERHWIDEVGFEEDPYVAYLFQEMGNTAIPLKAYTPDIRINKFSADVRPHTDYATVKEKLSDVFDFLEHDGSVIEVVPRGTSKASGIDWLCKYLGVDREDTYAVGDSVNDLDMLRFVGHSIAMGNASEAAKAAAEYVTTDIHADGILRAMQHYGLLDP
ncbi:MAG: Cof-type HAD-IIB family hydrolase [Muribaculaceae bacterium]|nr:Cof-type HAD-IIB family hydrolase [Roseburia sp.]MCM1431203.1 Cof-type HAD-IIB family hydrolase [Muribaculaceae bacterium]MCM1492311.1 Cof-type HAD-IIB family hydrolase [Muribaculaceae bacterium]